MGSGTRRDEKAGMWLRVSSTGQDEESQAPDCERWVADHGYDLQRTYRLKKSAYKGKHQAKLDEMLGDMRAGVISVIVVWQSSRIERRGAWSAFDLAKQVRDAGGRIEFVQDSYLNEANDMSDVMLALAATKDHQKSRDISKQVKAKHDVIRLNGALVGRPPFGFSTEGDKLHRQLVPTAEGERLIPEVFARVIKGDSLATVARWLSAETGKTWWARTVGGLIRNPAYCGRRCAWDVQRRVYGKTLHRCPALVTADIWKQAGEALDGRPKRGPVNEATRAMLSGAAFCPKCQDTAEKLLSPSPMYRIKTANGLFYRCSGKGAERRGCGNMIRCDVADAWVNQAIRREWDKPIMEPKVIPGNDHRAELENVQFEIRQLAQLDLPDNEYDCQLTVLRAERDRIKALPVVERTVQLVDTGRNYANEWASLTDPERARFLADQHIRVMIAKDELAISWIA